MFDFAEPSNKLFDVQQQEENKIEEMITNMLSSNFSQVYLLSLFLYGSNASNSLMGWFQKNTYLSLRMSLCLETSANNEVCETTLNYKHYF